MINTSNLRSSMQKGIKNNLLKKIIKKIFKKTNTNLKRWLDLITQLISKSNKQNLNKSMIKSL